jgi:hypothetical protein
METWRRIHADLKDKKEKVSKQRQCKKEQKPQSCAVGELFTEP